jgi:hypothetical protein
MCLFPAIKFMPEAATTSESNAIRYWYAMSV